MTDEYGRKIDYLRVSVTDRCNLRCRYCMPEEGITQTAHSALLTFDEIVMICSAMAQLGVQKIKLTGGEPLIRRDVVSLVRDIKGIPGIKKVTLTTNGILLEEKMEDLANAGIDNINVSLDTLQPQLYREITRRDGLDKALAGIRKALQYPNVGIKINCVPLHIPGQDLSEIAALAKAYPVHVRFIEMMPVGLGKNFSYQKEEDIVKLLEQKFGHMEPWKGTLGNGPSHYYELEGFQGKIGFISAISHQFCRNCNRIRLTSQGYLKTCLQYETGQDLRELIRGGYSVDELKESIRSAVNKKPAGHSFLQEDIQGEDHLCMSQIGG